MTLEDTLPLRPPESGEAPAPADPDFGPALAVYRGRPLSGRDLWLFFLPGLAGVGAPLAYGAWRAAYAYTHYGLTAAQAWSQPWYTLAGLALLCFMLLAVLRLHAGRPRAVIYRDGLQVEPALGRSRRYTWGALAGVSYDHAADRFLGLTLRRRHGAWLYPQVGERWRLPSGIVDLPGLVAGIQAQLYPRLAAALQTRFDAGEWVYFGALAVSRSGISPLAGAGLTPWQAVKSLSVRSGRLMVELNDGGLHRCPVAAIPNLELLFELAQRGALS